ncbi:toxin biosynthesis proten (Fum3) [Lecanosticta acicola]|uniref:Toxin biosynthesis proten (Fum3) n=1 Tax=Lecanosticta acicola TaxID=111012 RepID=A0AAI9E7P9_9PEZI|nr:toxin biosynthesis proten (Fum3) [Lecanosticta acicola]
MWRIPKDIPQTAESNGHTSLKELSVQTPLPEIFEHWNEDGAVIIKNLLSPGQLSQLQTELEPILQTVQRGSLIPHEDLQAFHGRKTKRAGDLVNHSAVFREKFIENDFLHSLLKHVFTQGGHAGTYWLSAASTLNAAGPQAAQTLHRDLEQSPPYVLLGPESTEAVVNFLVALTDFTEENGATRLIPGSNKWSYDQRGRIDQSIPALLKAGDCLFFSGKVVHGMGENSTSTERKCIQMSTVAGFLTPTEAHPFTVTLETAKKLSRRGQRYLGFRSQYPRDASGLWLKDYAELGLHLGLDTIETIGEDQQEILKEHMEAYMRDGAGK